MQFVMMAAFRSGVGWVASAKATRSLSHTGHSFEIFLEKKKWSQGIKSDLRQ